MDKSFILLDKNNNLEKKAYMIVKFNFEGNDYVVYSVDENEQNSQIFVSKLILNSEGKYFVDNILPEEKNKLSNIVYNIVILLPTDIAKGADFQSLINNLFNKFSVKLLSGLPNLDLQEYFSNCSIAITNKTLVKNAFDLYHDKLNVVNESVVEVPTWTAPLEVTSPTPVDNNIGDDVSNIGVTSISNVESVLPNVVSEEKVEIVPEVSVEEHVTSVVENPSVIINEPVVSPENVVPVSTDYVNEEVNTSSDVIVPNPQVEKLAIVSDPSLGIAVQQPNIVENKKAGFANTKYVVMGTICLVLAIAVVITAYILIKNMG